ncbi:acyltransferase [Granulicella sp. WH15]|nr:acyltransferase [Granulicella sp. WH15]
MLHKQLQVLSLALRRLRLPSGIKTGKGTLIRAPFSIPSGIGIEIGINTKIHVGSTILTIREHAGIRYQPKIGIGNDVYIGRYIFLAAIGEIRIGDGCVLSDYVYINDAAHGLHPSAGPIMKQALESKGPIRIGRNCFLGYRAAVLPGVTLGEGCVVGINAVVTRSFPAHSMLAGVPAKVIRTFDHSTQTWVSVS